MLGTEKEAGNSIHVCFEIPFNMTCMDTYITRCADFFRRTFSGFQIIVFSEVGSLRLPWVALAHQQ